MQKFAPTKISAIQYFDAGEFQNNRGTFLSVDITD